MEPVLLVISDFVKCGIVLKVTECCKNALHEYQFFSSVLFGIFYRVLRNTFLCCFAEFTLGMILPTKAMAAQELTIQRKLSEDAMQV